jgi:hypothetical protein
MKKVDYTSDNTLDLPDWDDLDWNSLKGISFSASPAKKERSPRKKEKADYRDIHSKYSEENRYDDLHQLSLDDYLDLHLVSSQQKLPPRHALSGIPKTSQEKKYKTPASVSQPTKAYEERKDTHSTSPSHSSDDDEHDDHLSERPTIRRNHRTPSSPAASSPASSPSSSSSSKFKEASHIDGIEGRYQHIHRSFPILSHQREKRKEHSHHHLSSSSPSRSPSPHKRHQDHHSTTVLQTGNTSQTHRESDERKEKARKDQPVLSSSSYSSNENDLSRALIEQSQQEKTEIEKSYKRLLFETRGLLLASSEQLQSFHSFYQQFKEMIEKNGDLDPKVTCILDFIFSLS